MKRLLTSLLAAAITFAAGMPAIAQNQINLQSQVKGTLPVANGGTAATTASAARTSLGLGTLATQNGPTGSTQCLQVNSGGAVSGTGSACGTGNGTVATSGSPASGNLAKFSGSSAITNGDLSGDVSTSGTLATTIANSAVTLSKIANASANSKLLGSGASGSGSAYSEITLGTNLSMTGTTLNASGGGGGGISAGTSFPGSPSTNDMYFRTDRGIIYFYDGMRWLSVNQFIATGAGPTDGLDTRWTYANDGTTYGAFPWAGVYDIYIEAVGMTSLLTNGSTASNYVTVTFRMAAATSGSDSTLAAISTQSNTQNSRVVQSATVNAVYSNSTYKKFMFTHIRTGSATFYYFPWIRYRLVG